MRLGFGEILLILAVALLIFGPSKLPQLGEALGKGIRNFKKSTEGHDDPAPPPAQQQAQAPGELPGRASSQVVDATRSAAPSERKPS